MARHIERCGERDLADLFRVFGSELEDAVFAHLKPRVCEAQLAIHSRELLDLKVELPAHIKELLAATHLRQLQVHHVDLLRRAHGWR